jgi:hypothetical protein
MIDQILNGDLTNTRAAIKALPAIELAKLDTAIGQAVREALPGSNTLWLAWLDDRVQRQWSALEAQWSEENKFEKS